MPTPNPTALSFLCVLSIVGCASAPQQRAEPAPAAQPAMPVKRALTGEAMYRLGRYFEGQARHENAIAAYREALKRDPLLVDAYTRLGLALAAQERYDEAIRQFQAAVVLAPDSALAHNNLGYAYLLSGAKEHAVKALEEATRLAPGHEKSRENLRVARAKLGTPATNASVQPAPGSSHLVAVAPQVFELRTPARPSIEALPLPPLSTPSNTAPPRRFRLEVSNGNGITGLAKRFAGRLALVGVPAMRLTNQRPFAQAKTEVQYRAGYAAEAARLAGELERPVQVIPSKELAPHVDVRLVLGRDVVTETTVRLPLEVATR
jgi:tetratricopeptide (TPR) repeat protein